MGAIRNRIDKNHDNPFGRGFTSKYPGVSWEKTRNNWRSGININGKNKFLGRYKTEIEAYEAYLKALKEL